MVIWVGCSGPLVLIPLLPSLPFLTSFTVHPHWCPHHQVPPMVHFFHHSIHHWHHTVPALVPSQTSQQPPAANSTWPTLSNAPPPMPSQSAPHGACLSISQWPLTLHSHSPSPRDVTATPCRWQHRCPQSTFTNAPTHKSPPQYILADFLSTTNAMWSQPQSQARHCSIWVPITLSLPYLMHPCCQGLAGPWYAQRERELWKQRFSGSMVQWFRWGCEPKLDRSREETVNCKE